MAEPMEFDWTEINDLGDQYILFDDILAEHLENSEVIAEGILETKRNAGQLNKRIRPDMLLRSGSSIIAVEAKSGVSGIEKLEGDIRISEQVGSDRLTMELADEFVHSSSFEKRLTNIEEQVDKISTIRDKEKFTTIEGDIRYLDEKIEQTNQELKHVKIGLTEDLFLPIALGLGLISFALTILLAYTGSIAALPTALLSLILWTGALKMRQSIK